MDVLSESPQLAACVPRTGRHSGPTRVKDWFRTGLCPARAQPVGSKPASAERIFWVPVEATEQRTEQPEENPERDRETAVYVYRRRE